MNCKTCGNLIDKDANFCPYCGNVVSQETNQKEYDDPFKELRMETTHDGQYQYQQNYSNLKQEKYQNEFESSKSRMNKSLIGVILGILSIFICFVEHGAIIGVILSIVAFVLTIIGMKKTSKGWGIFSIIITIITFIITLLTSIFLFVGSIELTFTNGYTTTIKQYLTDAFFCGYYEHHLEGYWINDSNGLLYLDHEGNYYIYMDANELTDNYYYGIYQIEEGLNIDNDETLFVSENYYLYEMVTMMNRAKISGTIYDDTINLIENGFTLKLDKENRKHLVLVSSDGKIEFEFEKE